MKGWALGLALLSTAQLALCVTLLVRVDTLSAGMARPAPSKVHAQVAQEGEQALSVCDEAAIAARVNQHVAEALVNLTAPSTASEPDPASVDGDIEHAVHASSAADDARELIAAAVEGDGQWAKEDAQALFALLQDAPPSQAQAALEMVAAAVNRRDLVVLGEGPSALVAPH